MTRWILLMVAALALGKGAQSGPAQLSSTQTPGLVSTAGTLAISNATPAPSEGIRILVPRAGQALQGVVEVSAAISATAPLSGELLFRYAGDQSGTWFLIEELTQAETPALLARWDTTTISDGNYDLLLRVNLADGRRLDGLVPGLRVRNYTLLETDTPTPITPTATPHPGMLTATPTASATPIPASATPFPPNPAHLTRADITITLGKGALAGAGIIAVIWLYALIRQQRR